MSKKLLSEAQVRRFAKLANLSSINEMKYNRDEKDLEEMKYKREDDEVHEGAYGIHKRDEKEAMREDAEEEIAMDAADAGAPDLPEPDEAELDDMGGDMDLGAREEIAMDVINAVADVLNIEVDIEGGEDEPEMEMDAEIGADDGDEEIEIRDEIMEALKGINYVPGRKEIVNEVAKRVAKRLLKAKRAEAQLQEALGNRRRRKK